MVPLVRSVPHRRKKLAGNNVLSPYPYCLDHAYNFTDDSSITLKRPFRGFSAEEIEVPEASAQVETSAAGTSSEEPQTEEVALPE